MKIGKKKIIVIGISAAVLLVFLFTVFGSSSDQNGSSLVALPLTGGAQLDQNALLTGEHADIVRMLNVLRGVSFDNVVLFNGDIFNSLIDFSVSLPSSEAGKSNPFSAK